MAIPATDRIFQGQRVRSLLEWNALIALVRLGWRDKIEYQVPYFGGRRLSGGTVVDIVLHMAPLPLPIYIDGEYWHQRYRNDKEWLVRLTLFAQAMGRYQTPLIVYGNDVETVDQAYHFFLREVGRAP